MLKRRRSGEEEGEPSNKKTKPLRVLRIKKGRMPTAAQRCMLRVGQKSLLNYGGVIFAAMMGSGKTGASLMLMMHMRTGLPNLFVGTVSIIGGVVKEAAAFFGDSINVHVIEPGSSDKSFPPDTDVVVTNRESLADPQLANIQWGHVTLDEAHDMRNEDTNRYGIMKAINAKYRILLTGTPINNRPEEVVSLVEQAGLIEVPPNTGHRRYLNENWLKVLLALQRSSIRIDYDPGCKIERHVVAVEFTPEEAEEHQKAIADAMAKITTHSYFHVFTCDLNLCASSQAKLRAIQHIVETEFDPERGMLIFATICSMQQAVLAMCQEMGIPCDLIDGSMSMHERTRVVDKLNNGELRLVVCSSKACRVGLNMQGAGDVINVDIQSCNPFDYMQLECRVKRKGQKCAVVRLWQLVIVRTVESYIPRILKWKTEMANQMLKCFPTSRDFNANGKLTDNFQRVSRAYMKKIIKKGKRKKGVGVETAEGTEVEHLIMKTYANDGSFIGLLDEESDDSESDESPQSAPITPRTPRGRGLWS